MKPFSKPPSANIGECACVFRVQTRVFAKGRPPRQGGPSKPGYRTPKKTHPPRGEPRLIRGRARGRTISTIARQHSHPPTRPSSAHRPSFPRLAPYVGEEGFNSGFNFKVYEKDKGRVAGLCSNLTCGLVLWFLGSYFPIGNLRFDAATGGAKIT